MGTTEGEMMGSWKWTVRYAVVLVVAIALGAAIAELPVFKQTMLATPKLSAAALAKFLGYGGALTVFWILGWRAAQQLRSSEGDRAHAGFLVLPLTTLIVLSIGYDVVLAILRAFFTPAAKDIYNWLFVAAITACAIWLVVALYQHAEGIVELLRGLRRRKHASRCAACNAPVSGDASFCAACGKALTAAFPRLPST
jgi:hypothetical protein